MTVSRTVSPSEGTRGTRSLHRVPDTVGHGGTQSKREGLRCPIAPTAAGPSTAKGTWRHARPSHDPPRRGGHHRHRHRHPRW